MQIEVPNGIIQDVETNRLNIEINALAIFKNAEEIAIAKQTRQQDWTHFGGTHSHECQHLIVNAPATHPADHFPTLRNFFRSYGQRNIVGITFQRTNATAPDSFIQVYSHSISDGHKNKIISVPLYVQEFSGFKDVAEIPVVHDSEYISVHGVTWEEDVGEMQVCIHWLLDRQSS